MCVLQLQREWRKNEFRKWILNLKSEMSKLTGRTKQQQNSITSALNWTKREKLAIKKHKQTNTHSTIHPPTQTSTKKKLNVEKNCLCRFVHGRSIYLNRREDEYEEMCCNFFCSPVHGPHLSVVILHFICLPDKNINPFI